MTHQTQIVGTSLLIGEEKHHGGGMRVMAADAGELAPSPGWIGFIADRMGLAEPIPQQNVFA
jgi:hypothetical protein